MTEIKEFDAIKIRNASIQYKDSGLQNDKFECLGSIEGETEMKTLVKRCEGVIRKSKSIPIGHSLTLTGYVPVATLRNIFGLTNDKLKAGIYSYGIESKGKNFCLTADVIDEFEDIVKLVAFPNSNSATGLKFSIDNDADETAYIELEFDVNPDEAGQFYYEAFVAEVDQAIATAWHTAFNRELVEEIEG